MKKLEFNEISLNHDLRSNYVFDKVFDTASVSNIKLIGSIPRSIVQYWDDPVIPLDVLSVMETWYSTGFEVKVFNLKTASDFIQNNFDFKTQKAFRKCSHPAMRADFFRLCYLYKVGGMYIDADDRYIGKNIEYLFSDNSLKVQSLCYDIRRDKMVDYKEYFDTKEFNSDYIYYFNNDPIIAPANHSLIEFILNEVIDNLMKLKEKENDIQAISGPGLLTKCVVQYHIDCVKSGCDFDVVLINWDSFSIPEWNLEYKKDSRNWRIWNGERV